ncbi:hypothetical protein Hanom_Chr11g01000121 [Helianthus anomalus]
MKLILRNYNTVTLLIKLCFFIRNAVRVYEIEFLHLLGAFRACAALLGLSTLFSVILSFVILLSFFHPLDHADCCFGLVTLSNCLCKFSMSCCSSKYFVFTVSNSNLRVFMSFFAAAHPS